MGATSAWVLIGLIVIAFICMIYDNLKCKHEWEQHNFIDSGATRNYLVCKKCGKVKYLK